ncbi:MAG TPA: MFS transporter [Steroidobacteraceae bacterium]|nr:MFS transporter [Steroidobacteraceae bacterium]
MNNAVETVGTIPVSGTMGRENFKVIGASSVASVFEWFDFFLYGSLAVIISRNFFSGVDESSAFVMALLAFAAGFAVRPFGAIVFGFFGDLWGRKNTFLLTLALMGVATFTVGLLPTYDQIGVAAPWILVALRMLQGLSVGGVYGGAAVYVAEHVEQKRRGFFTSWIQITATVGMALSLIVIFATRKLVGEAEFSEWGWRIPFLLSIVLLGVTIWIQMKLSESPVYLQMKASGKSSSRPWADAFGNWKNVRLILIALFGAMVGQAVVWYAAQFYVLFFLERTLKVDAATTNLLVAAALLISTPLYIFFGWLSDRVGRKPVILGACLLAALTYFPLFKALTAAANPALARAVATAPVVVQTDPRGCSFQFDPIGKATFATSCDIVRSYLTRAGITYDTVDAAAGSVAELRVGDRTLSSFHGEQLPVEELRARRSDWEKEAAKLIAAAGYPLSADPAAINVPLVLLTLVTLMSLAAMVYGPMAALLTELFPAKVRYTSMSLPYHLGTGWFGGFLPPVAFAIVAATGNIYSGLWYPLIGAAFTFIVGVLVLPETKHADLRE